MLRRALVIAALITASFGAPLLARAQATPLDGYRIRTTFGVGGGTTPTVGPNQLTDSPEGLGIDAAVGVVFPNRLYLGADFRWFAGARPAASVPMFYRAVRTTVDVGVEIGDRLVRGRFYVGVGHNLYHLVIDDLDLSRSSFVVAPGIAMLVGKDSGLFAGVDFRVSQVIRPDRSEPLAPTDGRVDTSLNFFFVIGWTFRAGS